MICWKYRLEVLFLHNMCLAGERFPLIVPPVYLNLYLGGSTSGTEAGRDPLSIPIQSIGSLLTLPKKSISAKIDDQYVILM